MKELGGFYGHLLLYLYDYQMLYRHIGKYYNVMYYYLLPDFLFARIYKDKHMICLYSIYAHVMYK